MEGNGARRPWLRAWLALGIAAWVELGVALVDRADSQGLVDDITFSPYHAVGYAALLVLGVYVLLTFLRGMRRATWRTAFPPRYGGLAVGFLAAVAWVVLDPVWRSTLGINLGIEGAFAPPRLLIPLGVAFMASGPIREAIALRAAPGLAPGEIPIRWAGALAVGILGAALTMPGLNPLRNTLASYATYPIEDRSEIWVMRPDGSGQTRVLPSTGNGVDWSYPVWSPDSSRIAYTEWTNDDGVPQNIRNEDQSMAIWTMAADGSDRRLAVSGTPDNAWLPSWSTDGAWLSWTVSPGEVAPVSVAGPQPAAAPGQIAAPAIAPGSAIWIGKVDGSEARRVSGEGRGAIAGVWSPDGTKLAYVQGAGPDDSDVIASTIGERLQLDVVVGGGSSNEWAPAWTPDGASILFVSNRDGNDEIYLRPSDGSGVPKRLTDDRSNDWVPSVSPDGTKVAFVSDRSGEPEIWVMGIDGSNPVNVSNNPFGFDGTWSVTWSPDGKSLVYAAGNYARAEQSGWVREDLAAAQLIVFGIALAVLGMLLVALGAPLGSFAVTLVIVALIPAIGSDDWRYVSAAVIGGLLVDGLVQTVQARWRLRVAASGLAGLGNLSFLLAIGAGGTLVWSITLVLGVASVSALVGWALGELVERIGPQGSGQPHRA